jgi:hypothetical protein
MDEVWPWLALVLSGLLIVCVIVGWFVFIAWFVLQLEDRYERRARRKDDGGWVFSDEVAEDDGSDEGKAP